MAKSSHRIRVHAAPGVVYQALATTDGLKGWFTAGVGGEVSEGHDVTMDFDGKDSFRWHVAESKPDRVHWNCLQGPGSANGTTVTYLLTGDGEARTVIECDHDGWPEGHEAYATCNTLWGILMGRLKDFAESGTPRPAFS